MSGIQDSKIPKGCNDCKTASRMNTNNPEGM